MHWCRGLQWLSSVVTIRTFSMAMPMGPILNTGTCPSTLQRVAYRVKDWPVISREALHLLNRRRLSLMIALGLNLVQCLYSWIIRCSLDPSSQMFFFSPSGAVQSSVFWIWIMIWFNNLMYEQFQVNSDSNENKNCCCAVIKWIMLMLIINISTLQNCVFSVVVSQEKDVWTQRVCFLIKFEKKHGKILLHNEWKWVGTLQLIKLAHRSCT